MSIDDLAKATKEDDLVATYVEEVLNHHSLDLIPQLFANSYVDRSPMFGARGGVDDLKWAVRFLAAPDTDVHFILEDVISTGRAVAYRLFGQGSFTLRDLGTYAVNGPARREAMEPWLRKPEEPPPITQDPTYKAIAGTRSDRARVSLTLETVGWFRLRSGRFVERWGPYILSW